MTKTWKVLLLSAMVATVSIPAAAVIPAPAVLAAAPTISLDKSSVSKGNSVTVTGTFSPGSWTSLRVIDREGNLVVFDAVKSNEAGQYSFTFIVPTTSDTGTLNVYTGSDDQVATAELKITSSGGGSRPSRGGGGGSSSSANTSPSSVGNSVITFKPVTTSDANGQKQATVAVDGAAVRKALEQSGDKLTITVDAANVQIVTVNLNNEALQQLQQNGSARVVEIVNPHGSYMLPAGLLNLAALAASLGVPADQVSIQISVTQASTAQQNAVNEAAASQGVSQVAGTVDFAVEVTSADGKRTRLDFGSTYVSRMIPLSRNVDPSRATGVRYNEATQKLSFVPTRFHTQDGQSVATLKRNGNSLYTVIENSKTFKDVDAAHWGKADIELLASKLVLNGLTEEQFGPDETVTRAELAAMVVRALGLEETKSAKFSDVRGSDWFAGAVGAAYKAGLVSGYGDGTFRPNQQITREELAVLIYNALELTGNASTENIAAQLGKFTDRSSIAPWAETAVGQMAAAGIAEGRSGNQFDPAANSTRAEAAAMIKRLLQHVDFID